MKKLGIIVGIIATLAVAVCSLIFIFGIPTNDILLEPGTSVFVTEKDYREGKDPDFCGFVEYDTFREGYNGYQQIENNNDLYTDDFLSVCKSDAGGYYAVIDNKNDKVCVCNDNFEVTDEISVGEKVSCVYHIDGGAVIQARNHTYLLNDDTSEISVLNFTVPLETEIFTFGSTIAYQNDNLIYIYNGQEQETVKIRKGFNFNGFFNEDEILLSKITDYITRFSVFSIEKDRITKTHFSLDTVLYITIDQDTGIVLAFSPGEGPPMGAQSIDLKHHRYHTFYNYTFDTTIFNVQFAN